MPGYEGVSAGVRGYEGVSAGVVSGCVHSRMR